MEELPNIPVGPAPWVENGPIWPRDTLLLGMWWLPRHIEPAAAHVHRLTFSGGSDGLVVVTRRLPASNADPQAVGVSRTHGCASGACRLGDESAELGATMGGGARAVSLPRPRGRQASRGN